MKHYYITYIFFVLIGNFNYLLYSDGFFAGTLVKTPQGYARIENLQIDDAVTAFAADGSVSQSRIMAIGVRNSTEYIAIQSDELTIYVALDQLFYISESSAWKRANELVVGEQIGSLRINDITTHHAPCTIYQLSLEQHHVYYVSTYDIAVHNIVPIAIGISLAFGGGSITFSGLLCEIALFGCILGAHLTHKKQSDSLHSIDALPSIEKPKQQFECAAIGGYNVCVSVPENSNHYEVEYSIAVPNNDRKKDIWEEKKTAAEQEKPQEDMQKDAPSKKDEPAEEAQAPGKPAEKDGFVPKKKWEGKNGKHRKNCVSKTDFFKNKKVKSRYFYWKDQIYKKKSSVDPLCKKGEYLKWDKLHNDVEVYDKHGRHVGSLDPLTFELYKMAVNGRKM